MSKVCSGDGLIAVAAVFCCYGGGVVTAVPGNSTGADGLSDNHYKLQP